MKKTSILFAAASSVVNAITLQTESTVGAFCAGMNWCFDQEVIKGCDKSIYHPNNIYEIRLDCTGHLWLKKHEDTWVHNIWEAPVWSHKRPDRLVM